MKRHRFFLDTSSKEVTTVSSPDLVHQIVRVLKLRVGEEIVLWNGDGNEYVFALEKISAKDIRGRVVRGEKNDREPDTHVTLYCAVLKRENFELVCQKATEVGVSEIVPLVTDRTVKMAVNIQRLKKIIQEAAEQSGRARIPVLCDAMRFDTAIRRVCENDVNYFFDCDISLHGDHGTSFFGTGRTSFKGPKKENAVVSSVAQNLGIFIGSEGGWSDVERAEAQKAGCISTSLGDLTLRGETAAIVATYMACWKL